MNDFDDLTDLDEVFGPLRSAATPAELAQDATMVERMVNAHRTAEGKHMFTSRRARVATLVAAGVLGFGGMAAASPNLLAETTFVQQDENDEIEEIDEVDDGPIADDDEPQPEPDSDPLLEPQPESEPEPDMVDTAVVETEVVEPVDETPADPAVAGDPDQSTEFDETYCIGDNHGATVSAVARGDADEFPEGFLADVSVTDAAHSSCGKMDDTEETDTEDTDIEDTDTEDDDADDTDTEDSDSAEVEIESEPKPEQPGGRDKGAGSNGNGNGNGNGRGGRGG